MFVRMGVRVPMVLIMHRVMFAHAMHFAPSGKRVNTPLARP
jgi:hypothetical protein